MTVLFSALALIPGRVWLYAGIVAALFSVWVIAKQHYVHVGWDSALETVKKQDGNAREAASRAQMGVDKCYDAGGAWSTITGSCVTEAK